jgi:hypothetical protein
MEVAQVRERRGILDRAPGVGNRALFAVLSTSRPGRAAGPVSGKLA